MPVYHQRRAMALMDLILTGCATLWPGVTTMACTPRPLLFDAPTGRAYPAEHSVAHLALTYHASAGYVAASNENPYPKTVCAGLPASDLPAIDNSASVACCAGSATPARPASLAFLQTETGTLPSWSQYRAASSMPMVPERQSHPPQRPHSSTTARLAGAAMPRWDRHSLFNAVS